MDEKMKQKPAKVTIFCGYTNEPNSSSSIKNLYILSLLLSSTIEHLQILISLVFYFVCEHQFLIIIIYTTQNKYKHIAS